MDWWCVQSESETNGEGKEAVQASTGAGAGAGAVQASTGGGKKVQKGTSMVGASK